MHVPYVYEEMVGVQPVNRLFNTQRTHTCQVNSVPNPSFAHQAPLLHLTSSILHPVVTFKAHPNQTLTLACRVFQLEFPVIFTEICFQFANWKFSAYFLTCMCVDFHISSSFPLPHTRLLSSAVYLRRVSVLWSVNCGLKHLTTEVVRLRRQCIDVFN